MSLIEQHCHQEQMSSLRRSAADPLDVLTVEICYTYGGADCPAPDTLHLFSVLPFPPLPLLWNVAFLTSIITQFRCILQWYVLSFTCISSRCFLQFASILQAGIIFQAIIWLLFFIYFGTKGTPLGSKCDKTHIHNNQEYEASAHFMHFRQLLTAFCGIIARQCIIYYSVGFPSGKELALLEMCNQLWSEICDRLGLYAAWNGNSYQHCPPWPLKMGPIGFLKMSVANWQHTLHNIPEEWRYQCKNCTQYYSP